MGLAWRGSCGTIATEMIKGRNKERERESGREDVWSYVGTAVGSALCP